MKPVKIKESQSGKKFKYHNELGCFNSEKEANRYQLLLDLKKANKISQLQCHITFVLLDAVYGIKYEKKRLKTKTKTIRRKVCVEQSVTLDVSFIYRNKKGKLRVEVVKPDKDYTDPTYILKRKLMRYLHQIVVIENK